MYWSFPSRHAHGYMKELKHFIDIALGKVKCSVSRQMTCAVSKIAEAAEESARKGEPIGLAWTEDEIPAGYVMN